MTVNSLPHRHRQLSRLLARRDLWLNLGCAAAILFTSLLTYWPVLWYSFFWEDPFDIGQVELYSYSQLFAVPISNSYYRPLSLILLKLLKLGQPVFRPGPYHLFVLGGHVLAGLTLFGLARYLFQSRYYALAAALIYSLYPVSFEAVAHAFSPHSWLSVATFASLLLYAWGRQAGRRWPAFVALAVMAVAQLTHENGVLFPGLALALEIWLVWKTPGERFRPLVLMYFVPAVLFIFLWMSIPKPAGLSTNLGLRGPEALYLSQGLSFPIARLMSQLGGFGLSPNWQAGLALIIAVALLIVAHGRERAVQLLLALAWWVGATSLVWLTRSMPYLSISPRVLYLGSFGAALAWAGVIHLGTGRLRWPWARQAAGIFGLAMILLAELAALVPSLVLYREGSRLMDEILAAGARSGDGARLLFVNVPDRFEYRSPLYPLGYWGMILAPVSQDLGDFVSFATGVHVTTRSLSDLPLLAGPLGASPYQVNTRGSDAHASDALYESARRANVTFLTEYAPNGRLSLTTAGSIAPGAPEQGFLARYVGVARLLTASARVETGGAVQLTLAWQAQGSAQPNDTVFVHLVNASDELVAQADGDSLAGLIPLSAWRAGDLIRDDRLIMAAPGLAPGEYHIQVGIYNRVTGQRYAAFDQTGAAVPDGSALAATVVVLPP